MNRIIKEYNEINNAKPAYIHSISTKDNLTWDLIFFINNLEDCPYNNGYYHVSIKFPENYPFKQPEFIFSKPNQLFHPNVDEKGQICKEMIGEWKPTKKAIQIIEVIFNMFKEPNLETPINPKAGELYKNNKAEFTTVNLKLLEQFASKP